MLTLALIAAAACAPKSPPEGSVDISESVGIRAPVADPVIPPAAPTPSFTGPAPLPLGQALPWEGEPATEPQRAFAEAEARLDALQRSLEPSMSIAEVLAVVEGAEAVRVELKAAAAEPELAGPAAVRMGDALRLADSACLATDGPPDTADPESLAREAARAEACAPLGEGALTTYRAALEINDPAGPWHRHAQWALAVLTGP